MQNSVVIAIYEFSHEAHLAKLSLEYIGIPSMIQDEHSVGMLSSNAIGGVKLLVPTENSAKAREHLKLDFTHQVDQEYTGAQSICPSCHSTNVVAHSTGKKPALLSFLLFDFPLFRIKNGNLCKDCQHFWRY